MIRIFRSKTNTPDQELAEAVRTAAKDYNAAVAAAVKAGLTVSAMTSWRSGEYSGDIYDKRLEAIRIRRNTSAKL